MARTGNRRRGIGLGLALLSSIPTVTEAHHGWGSYDTRTPLYLEGTVAEVYWRNPHPELVLVVETAAGVIDPGKVRLPAGAEGAELKDALARAQPAAPGRYTIHLPPIARLERAGVTVPPKPGERAVAIAYVACTEPDTARAAFVGFANGTAAVQQIMQAHGCEGRARS